MRRAVLGAASAIVFTLLGAGQASAQVVNLWPGVAPGSEGWTQQEKTYENTPVGTVIQNVATPTLTAFLPDPARATGTAVIIAPGGYFVALAISQEGTDVARWLQARGIAAFVLKYRILEKRQEGAPGPMNMDSAGRFGMADGIQAVKVVRRHAAEWGISPDRVGFLGFSAGGMVASAALLQADSAARPDFAALVYGAPLDDMTRESLSLALTKSFAQQVELIDLHIPMEVALVDAEPTAWRDLDRALERARLVPSLAVCVEVPPAPTGPSLRTKELYEALSQRLHSVIERAPNSTDWASGQGWRVRFTNGTCKASSQAAP